MNPPPLGLVFVAGFCVGGLALYSLSMLVLSSPASARHAMQTLVKKLGIGRWVTFREASADITCPRCGLSEQVVPTPEGKLNL